MTDIFKTGDRVRIRFKNQQVTGSVKIASANGRSLMLEFPDRMLGGYVEMMPVLWASDEKGFIDLIENEPVELEAVKSEAT